jgi:hypothetical protein
VRRVLVAMLTVVALLATGCGPEEEGRDLSDFAAGAPDDMP